MTEGTTRPLTGAWWQDPHDNRIHDAAGNDVLDYLPVTDIGKRVNAHDALVAALGLAYEALARVGEQTEAAAAYDALEAAK